MIRWPYRLAAFCLLLTLGMVSAHAEGLYDHNGSTMRITQDGTTVRIAYEVPRPGLTSQGVRPGTVLFQGLLDSNYYLEGMSRIFRTGCDIDYFVYGQYQPAASFTLSGASPVLARTGCQIVDNVYEGPNANLVFSYLRPASSAQQPNPRPSSSQVSAGPATGFGPFCVSGVSSTLNMRAGPGTQFGVIGQLDANRCGIAGYNRCQGGWCFIADQNSRPLAMGWVANQYLRASQ